MLDSRIHFDDLVKDFHQHPAPLFFIIGLDPLHPKETLNVRTNLSTGPELKAWLVRIATLLDEQTFTTVT